MCTKDNNHLGRVGLLVAHPALAAQAPSSWSPLCPRDLGSCCVPPGRKGRQESGRTAALPSWPPLVAKLFMGKGWRGILRGRCKKQKRGSGREEGSRVFLCT